MRRAAQIFVLATSFSLLATAQDRPDPQAARKDTDQASPEAAAARDAGIAAARKNALNIAHQIAASQGYRRRDTHWAGRLPDDGFTIIPLQLYADNDYYIAIGTDADAGAISAAAFTPDRLLVKTAPDRGEGKLAIHIKPTQTGPHYLRLHLKGKPARPVHSAVTYVYK